MPLVLDKLPSAARKTHLHEHFHRRCPHVEGASRVCMIFQGHTEQGWQLVLTLLDWNVFGYVVSSRSSLRVGMSNARTLNKASI